MGLYGKGDRAEFAQVGRLEARLTALEENGGTGTPGADGADGADSEVVVQQPAIADSTATTIAALKDDFNALLVALRASGLIAT